MEMPEQMEILQMSFSMEHYENSEIMRLCNDGVITCHESGNDAVRLGITFQMLQRLVVFP